MITSNWGIRHAEGAEETRGKSQKQKKKELRPVLGPRQKDFVLTEHAFSHALESPPTSCGEDEANNAVNAKRMTTDIACRPKRKRGFGKAMQLTSVKPRERKRALQDRDEADKPSVVARKSVGAAACSQIRPRVNS